MRTEGVMDKLFFWSLALVLITIPLPKYSLGSASLIFCMIIWIFRGSLSRKRKHFSENWRYFMILSSIFWIALCGMLFTTDLSAGMRNLQQYLPFLFLPLIFSTTKFVAEDRRRLLFYFSISVIIAAAFALSKALYLQYYNYGDFLFFDRYAVLLQKHTTYFSIFVLTAIAYFLFENRTISRFLKVLFIAFLIFQLYIVSTRMSVVGLVVLLLLTVWRYRQRFSQWQLLAVLVMALVPALLFLSPNFQKRINSETPKGVAISDTGSRIIHWQAVVNQAGENNFFVGAGTGDGHKDLYEAYLDVNFITGYNRKYNAHNQYLEMVLFYGAIGLVVFLFLLYTLTSRALYHRDYFYVALLLLFGLFMVTESVLERQSGIFLFSFLSSLLFYVRGDSRKYQLKGITIIGPYPPPVGGISLFIKKLSFLLRESFHDNIDIVNEFDSQSQEVTYSLSRSSKIKYALRLLYFLFFLNRNKIIYYNGAQALTRFMLTALSKILAYKIILHLHGRSAINFHNRGSINEKITEYTFQNADHVLCVNAVVSEDLKAINSKWKFTNLPAYIASKPMEATHIIKSFLETLPKHKEYYITYATLDKSQKGDYNYGILDLIRIFKTAQLQADNVGLILILLLIKEYDIQEYQSKIAPFVHDNVHVFINNGKEPLTPFFDTALGYIRWTYEDGWAGSLAEAMKAKIRVIASNVSERPAGTELFDPTIKYSLLDVLKRPTAIKEYREVNYASSYIDFFKSMGCTLKTDNNELRG